MLVSSCRSTVQAALHPKSPGGVLARVKWTLANWRKSGDIAGSIVNSYQLSRIGMQRTLRHCLKDYTFSILKTPEPYRTHNVKLDQFHLLYPKLMLDSIKFEKISEGSAGFGQKLTIFHVFRTQSNLVRSFQNFMESNISFG
jgi:hypothetical protein